MKATTKAIGIISLFMLSFLLVITAVYGAAQFYYRHIALEPTIEITQLDRIERKVDDIRLSVMPMSDGFGKAMVK